VRQLFRRALDIDASEEQPVYILLLNSFFLGLFLATFDVTASTLFIDTFGEAELPKGFIGSGILGVIFSGIFTFLQTRIPFSRLVTVSLLFIFIITLSIALLLEMDPGNRNFIYAGFALMLPLNSVALLGFYGMVSRSFSLRDEKRISGTVDQGQMIALTIAFFTIPFIENIFTDLAAYLFISGGSILLALITLRFYYRSVPGADRLFASGQVLASGQATMPLGKMLSNKYLRLLVLFALISSIAVITVEYSFLSVASQQYPDAKSLATFLAYYGGILTIFSLILQTFIGDRVISTYGMKVSLLILPAVVGIIAAVSAVIGLSFGSSSSSEAFIFFFLFVAMSKLFHNAIFDAFEDPISKTFFIPIDAVYKLDVQAKISGFFREFAKIIGGAALIGVSLLQFTSLSLFSILLVLLVGYYAYLVVSIYQEYRRTLTKTLQQHQAEGDEDFYNDFDLTGLLKKNIRTQDVNTLEIGLNLMRRMNPLEYQYSLGLLLKNPSVAIRRRVASLIKQEDFMFDWDSLSILSEKESDAEVKQMFHLLLADRKTRYAQTPSFQVLSVQLKSRFANDRLHSLPFVVMYKGDALRPVFNPLLRDTDSRVREAAILMSSKLADPYYYPLLVESLSVPEFANAAASALVLAGDEAIPLLEGAFYRSGQSTQTMARILQIYGRMASGDSIKAIWMKMDYPDAQIVSQVLYSLTTCGFIADERSESRIKQALEVEIGKAAWNIAAIEEIKGPATDWLKSAMEEEVRNNYKQIYMLLSLMYDPQSVSMVRSSIESGTIEGLVFAIELLDVFLADEIKPLLFPLLEDIPQSERNFKLQTHYPREDLSETEVLLHILNRDYNYLNRFTKSAALFAIAHREDMPPSKDIIANLFNPDPFISELAAYILLKGDREMLVDCLPRLQPSRRKSLEDHLDHLDARLRNLQDVRLLIEEIFALKKDTAFHALTGALTMELYLAMREWVVPRVKEETPVEEQLLHLIEHKLVLLVSGTLTIYRKSGLQETIVRGSVHEFGFLSTDLDPVVNVSFSHDIRVLMLTENSFLDSMGANINHAAVLMEFIKMMIEVENEKSKMQQVI
jgi:hypothetical protein